MLYHLTKEEISKLFNANLLPEFMNAEMLVATFRTSAEIVKEILPRPLSPTKEALATVFVAKYPETNFGCVYNEGALFIHCQYKGEYGSYCLSMPVDDDMALIGGREQYGYPKKMAEKIALQKVDDAIEGSVIRKGEEILRITCNLTGEADESFMKYIGEPTEDWDGVPSYKRISFLFKYFQSPGGGNFDYLPRLVREPVLFRNLGKVLIGDSKVVLKSTSCDPLGEIPVGEIINTYYGKWHNTMLPGKVVARVWNPMKFARYAFFKTDFTSNLLKNYDPETVKRSKEIIKVARRF